MAWPFSNTNTGGPKYPRDSERFHTSGLSCRLGTILDMSRGGARVEVQSSKPAVTKGQMIDVSVASATQRISLRGKVQWVKRMGWKSHQVGIKWVDLKPSLLDAVEEFAKNGFVSEETKKAKPKPAEPAQAAPEPPPPQITMDVEDLYEFLGIAPEATPEQVAGAYRKLARQWHPDQNKEEGAAEKFAQISKAYQVLKDAELRARYDAMLGRLPNRQAS
ncbi:MAG: DnaJ domain-containing protein [Phycisphaerales bacterium]